MSQTTFIEAWHFLPADKKLRYGDGRRVRTGCWHAAKYPTGYTKPVLCKSGMHASIRPIDALHYAPGPIVGLCEIRGVEGPPGSAETTLFRGNDKITGEARRYLAIADATETLHLFACDEAERALNRQQERGYTVDPRSREAIRVKRLWVAGQASDSELDAAWAAARDAAGDAAWDAAGDAAWDAAWAAAWDASNARLDEALRSLLNQSS